MALATWRRGDLAPELSLIPGFRVEASRDEFLIAHINRLAPDEVHRRITSWATNHISPLSSRHRSAMAGMANTGSLLIGELGLQFELPETDRYLWDFATLPEWQGYGIYPRLLQHILMQQSSTFERVWIIHAPENSPSGAGMTKAGLLPIGQLSFAAMAELDFAPFEQLERAQAGADLLGIPLIESALAPCWRCGGATHTHSTVVDADLLAAAPGDNTPLYLRHRTQAGKNAGCVTDRHVPAAN